MNHMGNRINFLRKVVRGGSDRSYGIQVARLAGVPVSVIDAARKKLHLLEENAIKALPRQSDLFLAPEEPEPEQPDASETAALIAARLREISIDDMTPRDALDLLYDLKLKATE